MKSKALKSYHLPADREILQSFDAKPYAYLIVAAIVGLLLAVEGSRFLPGIIVLFTSIFAIVILPGRLLIEFSEEYMVVYHRVNRDDCMLVYYEDVTEYSFEKNYRFDSLCFVLNDGREITVPMYNRIRTEKVLERFIGGKKRKRNGLLK